jgi:hypothetical protein
MFTIAPLDRRAPSGLARMSVYVDQAVIERRGRVWSRPTADSLAKLPGFTARIGLNRCSFHAATRHPHYEVTDQQRARALGEGACPVDRRQLLIAKALRRHVAEPHARHARA